MAAHLWSIGEAQRSKRISPQSDAAGYIAGLATWMLAAGVFIAGKAGADEMPPWSFCFWRIFLATLVLTPFVRGHFGEMGQFVRRRGLEAFVIGALGLGITQGLLFDRTRASPRRPTPASSFSTGPIITLVLAGIVLHEADRSVAGGLGSLIAFAGHCRDHGSRQSGGFCSASISALVTCWRLSAACTMAAYAVLLKRAKFELRSTALAGRADDWRCDGILSVVCL